MGNTGIKQLSSFLKIKLIYILGLILVSLIILKMAPVAFPSFHDLG